jgi:hypothetical protein
MKKLNSLPVALCLDLKRQVTPEDMLQYRHKHPDQKLSFICPECRLPLTFQPRVHGITAQGYFIRRSGHNHQTCLHKLRQENPTPKDVKNLQDFEGAFEKAEESFKKLRYDLGHCHRLYLNLIQEVRPQLSLKQIKAFQEIEVSFAPLKNLHLTLETFFKKTETDYVFLRGNLKGY